MLLLLLMMTIKAIFIKKEYAQILDESVLDRLEHNSVGVDGSSHREWVTGDCFGQMTLGGGGANVVHLAQHMSDRIDRHRGAMNIAQMSADNVSGGGHQWQTVGDHNQRTQRGCVEGLLDQSMQVDGLVEHPKVIGGTKVAQQHRWQQTQQPPQPDRVLLERRR